MEGAISVGRNIGNVPMDGKTWRSFVREVRGSIKDAGGIVYATARGNGKWNGIPEKNAVVTFAEVSDTEFLAERLGKVKETYHQDAIVLLVGTSQLV